METQSRTLWAKDSEWLKSSRKDMWNPEYFSFLVSNVWKIDKPVNIIDFGCGIGYLGSVLLPLLPKGSSYTGLDSAAHLINEARSIFAGTEWNAEFVEEDITSYVPVEKYDIAICQTVLIHIPAPVAVLEKMARSVVTGGRVICIEPNWAFTCAGTYRHNMEVYSYEDFGLHQKINDRAVKNGTRDPYIGIKLPAYMHDLGLKNIDIRINDKASFAFKTPDKEKVSKDRTERREKRFNNADFYVSAGLDRQEAERHVESILRTEDYENNRDEPLPTVNAMAWLISYGEK